MKKTVVVAVVLAFVLLAAGAALADVTNSKHDMRTHMDGAAATGGFDEVCVYCHTPHSGSTSAQLWNRTNPTNGGYSPYTSGTMNATMDGTLGAGSLLCMSCHDGTIAVDSLVNDPNTGTKGTSVAAGALGATKLLQGTALLGTNLSNDHPVGFAYADSVADTSLNTLISVQASTAVRLIGSPGTQVECATCHDAHNTTNPPFLRSSNAGSAMCRVCHTK